MTQFLNSLLLSIVLFFLSVSISFSFSDRQEEINQYINGLNSPTCIARIDTLKLIGRSAITDTALYDIVEQKLKATMQAEGDSFSKEQIDEISWLCKALASSGNYKYRPAIEEVLENTSDSKIRNYAKQSLVLFEEYSVRNKITNDQTNYDGELTPEENRIANMLKSAESTLKRDAAKLVSRMVNPSPKLFDMIYAELVENYSINSRDSAHVDAMAWFIKTLAATKEEKYLSVFKDIHHGSNNSKLKTYARKAIESIDPNERIQLDDQNQEGFW